LKRIVLKPSSEKIHGEIRMWTQEGGKGSRRGAEIAEGFNQEIKKAGKEPKQGAFLGIASLKISHRIRFLSFPELMALASRQSA
jgi:hypothetical protein